MKILIPQDISNAGKEYLEQRGYEYSVCKNSDEETLVNAVKDCDGILIRTAPITRNIMEAGTKLRVISKHGVGVDNIDMEAATELGIQVTNGPLSNYESAAEHAAALIMACAHHVTEMDANVRMGNWESRNQVRLTGLSRKTVGIIGLGRIGRALAKIMADGLNMKIIAYDSLISEDNIPPYIHMVQSFEELFRNSDFVTVHCPLTPKTKGSISSHQFAMMKPGAFLINTARGGIVDEAALYQALDTGIIKGAALDVFEVEPPGTELPLERLKNIIFSPHCSANSYECFDNMGVHAAMGIDEVLKGREVTWKVNHLTKEIKLGENLS